MSALAAGQLVRSHMKYNRSNQNVAASVEMEVRAKNKVI
jgi:hypothetical protein